MPLMRKRGRPSTFYTFENGRSRKQTKIIKVEDTKLHVPPIPDVIEEQKIETEPEPTSSTSTDIEEVSGYTKAKTQRLENWGGIYKKLVAVGLEQNAVTELTCNDCGINTIDLFRCIDCISTPVLCFDCLEERHKHPHLHIFEKWMHGTFFGYSPPTAPWKIKIHADCERSYLKELVIVDEKGRQHLRTVQFCTCEEEAETLLRFNLWASSPKHPRLAFHIDLLRWLNGLLLECKVSAQGFCEALKARQPKLYKELVTQEGKQIYKTLINETIHQFRQYIYQMDYCTDLFPDLDDGCSCPACFEADKNIYCFDADFQLVRKSSSGQHWISPKHKDHFFIEQQLVDDFISSYGSLKVDKECSDFQAGNDIRSKSKNQKLSETAVFGATCRHDFPQKFFSLKHGERLGYAVFLIQLLLKENKNDKIHVSYDIACMLKRHIEKAGNKEISQNVTFSIPIFHCYGHSASCQIIYGPRRTEGIGLTDGEGIERLWSYLGGFSNISKEMSPENRRDLLTDALIHYGRKIRDKQGEVLVMKIKRTIQLMETTKVALREILATVPELEIKDDTVMEWIEEEKRAVLSPNNSDSTLHLSKADEYVINLQRFFKISGHQSNEETSEEDKRLEKQLMIFEKKHHSIRPTPTSDQFTSDLILAKEKERKLNLNAIRSHMSERQYLLRLMRKYAKGQSVFARLSKQLKGVSKKIQKSITLYNNVGMPSGELPVHVLFDTVKDLDSEVYKTLQLNNAVDTVISSTTKQEIIQSKCLLDRCHEEMNLLKIEMLSVINWNKTLYSKIKLQINSSVTPGSTALLLREGMSLELAMCKLNTLFKEYIGEVLTETTLTEGVLTDDFEKMQQMLMYLASVEELPIEEIDSDIEDSDEDEDSLEL